MQPSTLKINDRFFYSEISVQSDSVISVSCSLRHFVLGFRHLFPFKGYASSVKVVKIMKIL